jgi:hypothetical protein
MKKSKFSESQIVNILTEAEAACRWKISVASTGSAKRHFTSGKPNMVG